MSLYTHLRYVLVAIAVGMAIVAVGDFQGFLPGILTETNLDETQKTLVLSVSALIFQYVLDWLKGQEQAADAKIAGDTK